jgi:TetR/AcrR family transcriptional repressor of nem operon
MPYRKDHKQRTYQRILQSARRLFLQRGYAATSIEQIMLACGLTRGGFYAHFDSKSQLYREAMHSASLARESGRLELAAVLREWLHAPRATFLVTDVGSGDATIRTACSQAFQQLCFHLRQAVGGTVEDERVTAAALMIVGTLAMVRAKDDPQSSQEMLSVCDRQLSALLRRPAGEDSPQFFWAPQPENDRWGSCTPN